MTHQERAFVSGMIAAHAKRKRPSARRLANQTVVYIGGLCGLLIGGIAYLCARWTGESSAWAVVGAVLAWSLLLLCAIIRANSSSERKFAESMAAAYDEGKRRLDAQLESGEVEIVEFEADRAWQVATVGPWPYVFRVEPDKFLVVAPGENQDFRNDADRSTVPSKYVLEFYARLPALISISTAGAALRAERTQLDAEKLVAGLFPGSETYCILTIDDMPSGFAA